MPDCGRAPPLRRRSTGAPPVHQSVHAVPASDSTISASTPGARLRIAITGASGFIGQRLVPLLASAGHTVLTVSRHEPRAGTGDIRWDPARGVLDPAALDGVDAVIHMAGARVDQRWSDQARREIRESRTLGTALLARTLAGLERRPSVLLSVSATGYYGNGGERVLNEQSAPGTGFLAGVVQEWESAADAARAAGIRVAHPRLGVVLGDGGGALERLLPPFRMGLGGRIGDGEQWMSWIAREDAARAFEFLLQDGDVAGPVNVVAPEPVRNATFTRVLADVLGRPALTVVPAFALRALYGQMAEETLLVSQRVSADRLLQAGFAFRYPALHEALASMGL